MVVIKVPDMGEGAKVEIRRNIRFSRNEYGERAYSRVTFIHTNGGRESYVVGSPAMRLGDSYPALWDTVSSALSFLDADAEKDETSESEADGWIAHTAIPIGIARVFRHEYQVTDDGHGGSDVVKEKIRKGNVPLTRYYDEDLGSAVMRCLVDSGWWEDAGTFDCSGSSDPTRDDLVWSTFPEPAEGDRNVRHDVSWRGDIIRWLPELRQELKVAGVSW